MFTFKQRVMIAYQVVRGLAHLHTNKIVHGMLVPRNITFSQLKKSPQKEIKLINCNGKKLLFKISGYGLHHDLTSRSPPLNPSLRSTINRSPPLSPSRANSLSARSDPTNSSSPSSPIHYSPPCSPPVLPPPSSVSPSCPLSPPTLPPPSLPSTTQSLSNLPPPSISPPPKTASPPSRRSRPQSPSLSPSPPPTPSASPSPSRPPPSRSCPKEPTKSEDVWAFGALLYYLLCLESPFTSSPSSPTSAPLSSNSHFTSFSSSLTFQPEYSKCPPGGWVDILLKCWDPDVRKRPSVLKIESLIWEQLNRMDGITPAISAPFSGSSSDSSVASFSSASPPHRKDSALLRSASFTSHRALSESSPSSPSSSINNNATFCVPNATKVEAEDAGEDKFLGAFGGTHGKRGGGRWTKASVNLTWRKRHDKGDKRRQTVDIFEDLPEEMEGERGSGEKESPKEQGKDKQESKEQEHKEKEKDQQDDKQEKKEEIPQQQEQQQEQEKQEKEQRQQQTQQQQLANDFLSLVDSEPFHDVEIFVGTPEVKIYAHKVILCSRNAVLREKISLLSGIVAKISYPEQNEQAMRNILKFLYGGVLPPLSLDEGEAAATLKTARLLKVEEVVQELEGRKKREGRVELSSCAES